MPSAMIGNLIGARVERTEDDRILTGSATYVDDVVLPGMLHATFLRSPHAHARIRSVDATAARALPGVHAVLLASDLAPLVAERMNYDMGVPGHRAPLFDALTGDKVRYVGDPIAVVVADSRALAEDAAELIVVDYEPLPLVMSVAEGLAEGAPVVFEDLGDNVIYHDERDDFCWGDVDGAFRDADHVVSMTLRQHRFGGAAMETRGAVATWDAGTGHLTYHASTQSVHLYRMYLARYLGVAINHVHVTCKDVGGAFGFKWAIYREDVVIAAASRLLGRPVKWTEDRLENLVALGSAREETLEVKAAVDADGRILAVDVHEYMDHGSYPAQPPAPVFAALCKASLMSALRVSRYRFRATIVVTNKNPFISYRGPGSVESLARERLLDRIGVELGLDPVEVRRRNLIESHEQPTKMATGATIDKATARETLEEALRMADYEGFRERQRTAREEGRYIGIGIANAIHPFPAFPDWWESIGFPFETEPARVRVEPDGTVTVITAQNPHGQSHQTTLAQIVATELGVRFEDIRVLHSDTDHVPFHFFGTGASKAATMASGAVLWPSRELRARLVAIAAHQLEAAPEDLEVIEGVISVKGSRSKSVTVADCAATAYMARHTLPDDVEKDLEIASRYDGAGGAGWSSSTHICFVDVDVETGKVSIDRYLVVEDCGTMINPAVVEGQICGGVAQGIAGMLLEHAAYDENGQFKAASFHDYLVPTAVDIPPIEFRHLETPGDDPVNFRGVGEGGAGSAPPAVTNAIEDALQPFGVCVDTFPLTPSRMLELLGIIPA
jgi:carbon-monoxide dehydrogenase large subunit